MAEPARRFLVLHGWQNRRPAGHWQWQLTEALRSAGEQVLYPQLPSPTSRRCPRGARCCAPSWPSWVPGSVAYADLGLDVDVVPGAAHLDLDAGYGRWPSVEAWCRDPRTRLAPR